MEGIREIANAYYARASEEERNAVKEYFKSLDRNRDGKISLKEFRANVGWLTNPDLIFKQLDENGDKALDFNEALALHYMYEKVKILECDGCGSLLAGPYFSCLPCLEKGKGTYDLCCACYHGGKYEHGQHPPSDFFDHHYLLMQFRKRTEDAQRNQGKNDRELVGTRVIANAYCARASEGERTLLPQKERGLDGIREIAKAYYARASEEERNSVKEYFKSIDRNRDGKISLKEFRANVGWFSNPDLIFKQLDENGDKALDFNEALALHYMYEKVEIHDCKGCGSLLAGPYFSCLTCLEKGEGTYDLCCACYHGGKYEHRQHPPSDFLDHHALLMLFRRRTRDEQINQGKQEMEELRKIAEAHFQAGSQEVQKLAHDFFNALDTDEDGRVDLSEFLEFMRQQGHAQMRNPNFFEKLDRDGNNTLDFWEVMTLYYIIKSGRPFCDCCNNFIPGIYFSCVECFKSSESSFNLCRGCYKSTKCNHNHDGKTQFLDTYTLLEAQRNPALALAAGVKEIQLMTSGSSGPNPSNAIVPASKVNKWSVAFKAFEAAIAIGSISSTLCTIL